MFLREILCTYRLLKITAAFISGLIISVIRMQMPTLNAKLKTVHTPNNATELFMAQYM